MSVAYMMSFGPKLQLVTYKYYTASVDQGEDGGTSLTLGETSQLAKNKSGWKEEKEAFALQCDNSMILLFILSIHIGT